MTKRIVNVYPVFERLWHWSQALLIIVLLFTGMGLNGLHSLLPFGPAVMIHTIAALMLLALWIFATFWLFTTGTWRPVRAQTGRYARGCTLLRLRGVQG